MKLTMPAPGPMLFGCRRCRIAALAMAGLNEHDAEHMPFGAI